MAVSPINVVRVSHNMRTNSVINTLRQNQLELFGQQTRIATGRSFASPSEDPVAASRSLDLSLALERQKQFSANIQNADNVLVAADSALTEINTLLSEAQTIASQNLSNLTSAAEREAEAELIAGIRRQLQIVGNRDFNGRFIFGGRETTERPFVEALGGVAYVGDTGELVARINENLEAEISVPGNVLFGALSNSIAGDVDLRPTLTQATRLDTLDGATGSGITPGTLIINEIGGAGVVSVDLTSADTIGDVVNLINATTAEAGVSLTASLTADGITITPDSFELTVTDTSTGVIARDLGILTIQPTSDEITGGDLGPRVTRVTPVADLAGGAGVDLEHGLVITNGSATQVIDLSEAETVQDIINAINNAGVYVFARINEAGTGIDVFNQVSGTSMSVGENGGTTASDLGIRTYGTATPIDDLNFSQGLHATPGEDDLRITAANGTQFDVNVDGAQTIGDVLDLINTAAGDAGVNVAASLAEVGNGIRLLDSTGGSGSLRVAPLNQSAALTNLGLADPTVATDTEIVGADGNAIRTDGIMAVLVELEQAMRSDDTQGIALAGERIDPFIQDVTRVHGIIGARSQSMQNKLTQMQDASVTTELFLSEVKDLDYAEAITQMNAATTQLEASLRTSSILLNLSLLDFLA